MSITLFSCSSTKHCGRRTRDLSPYDYGLAEAKTGEERYKVLYETHKAAVAAGVNVDYSGIDTIRIEIPVKSSPIPLTNFSDFKGCVFCVKNTTKNFWLFRKTETGIPIQVNKRLIDSGDFRSLDSLRKGRYLLLIEDENPWVLNRTGHDYSHQRKDILLIEDGKAKNSVTMPYNNEYSRPKCSIIKLNGESLVLKNITIIREPRCTYLTHITNISGLDDVTVSNVTLYTPENSFYGDWGIRIYDCTNVTMDNVHIYGTYSQVDQYGYGINLSNVWNFNASRLYGKANWGVFGNNNINTARITDSQINRFDIHCYGRDISFKNVDFFDLYNQYASVYGTIQYERCSFSNFVPVLNGGSYNSYVAHEVVINDCTFNATPPKNSICRLGKLNDSINERPELSKKCWPNLSIKNLTVNMREGAEEFYLFWSNKVKGNDVLPINYLSRIKIDGLILVSDGTKPVKRISLSNHEVGTINPVVCEISNVEVHQPISAMIKSSDGNRNAVQLKTNMTIKNGKVDMKNVKGIRL